jgi:hypothetical protein
MSYDTLKTDPARERIDVMQITVEKCSLTNGTAPCTATATCFNSWATCKDKTNWTAADFTLSFCTPASICPDGYIPFLKSVQSDSGEPDPENGLGKRTSVSFTLLDAPHDDIGIDPYVSSRTYNPMERGTFWPRFKTRWPFYNGRSVKWYRGYVHEPFSLANCKRSDFIAEELRGWGRGNVVLTAKDPLKLADNDRAEYPIRSTGRLETSLDATTSYTTIDIITDRPTEYAIQSWEPSFSAVRIGDEIYKYTGTTAHTGGIRLTGVTVGGFDQYETTRTTHAAGDLVQKCAYFKAMRPIDVFRVLLEDGAAIDSAYIPYADWLAESTTWIAGFRITRLVCDPEGIKKAFDELIPQTSTWAIWWDEESREIQYRCVRPPDLTEIISSINDDEHIISGSVKCLDDSARLLNEVFVTMGQRDPVKKIDDIGNYRDGFVTINTDSQGVNEYNGRRSKSIFGCWHPTGNRAELTGLVDRMLLNRSFVPFRVELQLDRKDDSIKTGEFINLTTIAAVDEFGEALPTLIRVLKSRSGDNTVKITARQDAFASGRVGAFARIAPDTFTAGTEYSATTTDEQAYYMFIAADDGFIDGSVAGKVLL